MEGYSSLCKEEGIEKTREGTPWPYKVGDILILISFVFYSSIGKIAMRRVLDTSKETEARLEKHGQHKLGQDGYQRLKARIVSAKKFNHIIYII